mmetsp:Transcript_42542/g.68993  ORF Transcript_42542/g.68993 Transcript_42542/m.68993 type:complete len:173 (-) Transcript_42542:1341-1859(-)
MLRQLAGVLDEYVHGRRANDIEPPLNTRLSLYADLGLNQKSAQPEARVVVVAQPEKRTISLFSPNVHVFDFYGGETPRAQILFYCYINNKKTETYMVLIQIQVQVQVQVYIDLQMLRSNILNHPVLATNQPIRILALRLRYAILCLRPGAEGTGFECAKGNEWGGEVGGNVR